MNKLFIMTMILSLSAATYANEPAPAGNPGAPAAGATQSQEKISAKPEAQAVNSACTAEANTANCVNEKVGTGLIKCIHAYKKHHKDFKLSDGCKSAMKSLKMVHKAK